MIDLSTFTTLSFPAALKDFFTNQLGIHINDIGDAPASAVDILGKSFKPANEAHKLIDKVYAIGLVDDATFAGKESIDFKKLTADYDGLLLFGVTLHSNHLLNPTRSQLAEITRAINREFPYTPVTVVFKYNHFIAFANTERIPYKQEWRVGERISKVTLLKDVNTEQTHSGHLQILADLRIANKSQINTYATLYQHWQTVLNVDTLTKAFYAELSDWYSWTISEVEFPNMPAGCTKEQEIEHNSKNVIRLLTRLLFVWFLKQKHLIPDELFEETYISDKLLKDFTSNETSQESLYYKAILQNLFFATLNCPITSGDTKMSRGFRSDSQHFDVNSLMRYKKSFKNPQLFVDLMNEKVPFLNGGLFDCLDDKPNKVYIDGFSDNLIKPNQLRVPDYLFFGDTKGQSLDLSWFYGDNKKKKSANVRGLINILNSYKFTIEENTPFDQEVSLDPELLGKVFENLLASYNPETKTTARKQTGSFYTPREIVQYMVDESLIAHLKRSVGADLESEYRKLVQYTEAQLTLTEVQKNRIIKSMFDCKIIDPACGSGAFPVGVLQQMVHILSQLDPDNIYWHQIVKDATLHDMSEALDIQDHETREEAMSDINRSFNKDINRPDYARKLYLIENCIYGVDIQSIAVQISKLRFFISLVVEQTATAEAKDNFGIRPLPNLEAKFVAANTLVGLEKREATLFDTPEIAAKEAELKQAKHRIYGAKTSKTKKKYKDRVAALRVEIADMLVKLGAVGNDTARQLAQWDMFDQNASASFFDPEWMFGLKADEVISKPQSVEIDNLNKQVESINLQIATLNHSLKNGLHTSIITLQFINTDNQINTIKEEINIVRSVIEKLSGKIQPPVVNMNVVCEPENFSYAINSLNMRINRVNAHMDELNQLLKANVQTGGYFDIVIGNPPYGATLSLAEKEMYAQKYALKTSETAILFIEQGLKLLNNRGVQAYIIPKSFSFASNYAKTRDWVEPHFTILVDCGKAFDQVKMEACIILLAKNTNTATYKSVLFVDNGFVEISKVDKKYKNLFGLYLNGISSVELSIGDKVFSNSIFLGAIAHNSRGEILQKYISNGGDYEIIGGKEINKYGVRGIKGRIDKKHVNSAKCHINANAILAQRIVAHITKPYPQIKIIACIPNKKDYILTDTINQISIIDSLYSSKYIWALLNAKLVCWYAFNFIYGRAIRTMQFDNPVTDRIPIKQITMEQQQPIIDLVDVILEAKKSDPKADTTEFEAEIDRLVYELYGLTEEEIRVIENR